MTNAKILTLDIETIYINANTFGTRKVFIGPHMINRDWFILSWAAKWLGEDYTYSDALPHYKEQYAADPYDDTHIMASLWDMIDEADIVIGHNSDRFDLPKIQTRMFLNGMDPYAPVRKIDTLKVAKHQFAFSSNKLDYIAHLLGLGTKLDTGGLKLWDECLAGNKEAWRKMEEYNCYDVVLTEQVYLKMRPWITNHPNLALYVDDTEGGEMLCPVCLSKNIRPKEYVRSNMCTFRGYKCYDCGSRRRGRKNSADRTHLLANIGG